MTENQQMQPEQRHIKALRRIAAAVAGTSLYVNKTDREECENYGWVEALPNDLYTLTDEGRAILAGADSN